MQDLEVGNRVRFAASIELDGDIIIAAGEEGEVVLVDEGEELIEVRLDKLHKQLMQFSNCLPFFPGPEEAAIAQKIHVYQGGVFRRKCVPRKAADGTRAFVACEVTLMAVPIVARVGEA